jgi:two-component system sensor histidine kinase GlrK
MAAPRFWPSFRQLLLVSFLLIAALLGGIALKAVWTFDALMLQSSGFARSALNLSGSVQALSERSATMERAARQSLILNDAVLRRRFAEAGQEAEQALERLGPAAPAALLADWRARRGAIDRLMVGPPETAFDRERAVAAGFRELDAVNTALAQDVQRGIEKRNADLNAELDASRMRSTRHVVAAIALAVALAIGLGVLLARPFKRIERAIDGLGENRLDLPIEIRGPSDVREVGQRLDWLRLRLTELDADKARFLRHISHELKTPLAAMHEGVSLLEDGVTGDLTEGQREVTRILRDNTRMLQEQIEALLRFNAAAFEARQLRRQPTELRQLLEDQVDLQRLQWQAQALGVEVRGEPLTLQIDAGKIATVVGNLLSNAIRFSPRGGSVTLDVARDGTMARIDIQDDGPGVAEHDRARIFEPFYRGQRQPASAAKGTGVGLSIVQEYVAAHGGRVELLPAGHADSRGAGAHFRIRLPHAA